MEKKNILDFLETIDLEKFNSDQKYRNEIFNTLTDYFQDVENVDVFFESGMDEKSPYREIIKNLSGGLTPVEMAGVLFASAPGALESKADDNITHTWQYFGEAGKGKTATINYALGAVNGLIFSIGKRLRDGVPEDKIKSEVEKFAGTIQDTLKAAGIDLDPKIFATQMIEGTKKYIQKISESKEGKELQNSALDMISKDTTQDVLANTEAPMTKLAKIDPNTGKIDLASILPSQPIAVQDDLLQNVTDPNALSTMIQKLGEKNIPLSMLVITSNHTREAYDTLAKTFGMNEGFKARAGLFINSYGSAFTNTKIDKEASSSLMTDALLVDLFEELKNYIEKEKEGSLISAIKKEKGGEKMLNDLVKNVKKISSELGVNLIDVVLNNADKLSPEHYRMIDDGGNTLHRGKSLLLTLMKGKLGEDNFKDLSKSISDIFKLNLPLAQIIADSNTEITGYSADDLKKISDAFFDGDIENALNGLKEKATEKSKVLNSGIDRKEILEEVKNSLVKLGEKDKQMGRAFPDVDLKDQANSLAKKVESGKIDIGEFQKLNHRDTCALNESGQLEVTDLNRLRHFKQMFKTIETLKINQPEGQEKTATKLILSTLGPSEISKQMIKGLISKTSEVRLATPEDLMKYMEKELKNYDENKDFDKFIGLLNNVYRELNKGAKSNEIVDLNAFIEDMIARKIKSISEKFDGKNYDVIAEEFDSLHKLNKFIENFDKLDDDKKLELLSKIDDEEALSSISLLLDEGKEKFAKMFNDGEYDKFYEPIKEKIEPILKEIKDKFCEGKHNKDLANWLKSSDINKIEKAMPIIGSFII